VDAHYSIREGQIGVRQRLLDRGVHVFFFNWEGHLLAFLHWVLHNMANLGFLIPNVHWPITIRLAGMRLTMAVLRVVRLATIFAVGLWFLDALG
jgi:hypothetical protein